MGLTFLNSFCATAARTIDTRNLKGHFLMPLDRQPPGHVALGTSPSTPASFSLPPVETQADQPLPDAGPFLRVFAGAEEPTTVMLRCAHQYIGILRVIYDHRRDVPDVVHEQLSILTFLIDHEAEGDTKEIAVQPSAPLASLSYAEMVTWLAWKYLLYTLRRNDPEHRERDAYMLSCHIEAFDQLVSDVRAGGVQLPDTAADALPPQTVRLDGTEDVHGQPPTTASGSDTAASHTEQ
ncbi:hypothetical protein AB0J47_22810 [Nocardia sp. NPDC049737]|uniref:hypothetical protein n=1 Tax=Nocardia sp. NPDC049737 TaxID=3154358 RepID=UPI00343857FC